MEVIFYNGLDLIDRSTEQMRLAHTEWVLERFKTGMHKFVDEKNRASHLDRRADLVIAKLTPRDRTVPFRFTQSDAEQSRYPRMTRTTATDQLHPIIGRSETRASDCWLGCGLMLCLMPLGSVAPVLGRCCAASDRSWPRSVTVL